MSREAVDKLARELELWQAQEQRPQIWWRDDDAVKAGAELARLEKLAGQYSFPVTLAVIPQFADQNLSDFVRQSSFLNVATHGYGHHNHAAAMQKKTELTENLPHRDVSHVWQELIQARNIIRNLFDEDAGAILVPPWNRISLPVLGGLDQCGFKLLSTFGERKLPSSMPQINCHVDLMDWKPLRRGKPVEYVLAELVDALEKARFGDFWPVGILSHHLVHDDTAWMSAEFLMKTISSFTQFEIVSLRKFLEN